MSQNGQPGLPGRSLLVSSIGAIATLCAFVFAFFGTAPFYARTIAAVQSFAADHYARGFEEIIGWVWLATSALTVFFVVRALTGGALYLASVIIARRTM